MTKILYVIENIFFGGGERVFAQIVNGLDKKRYEIYVACSPGGVFLKKIKNCAQILHISLREGFFLYNILQLSNFMKEKNIQIVHSQGGRADFFARIAAKMANVPAVISTIPVTVECYNASLIKKLIYIYLDRFSERFVNCFIVVNESLKEALVKTHKIADNKIVKIYNGVEVDVYNSSIAETNSLTREEFGPGNNTFMVGFIGRLVWQKGVSCFLYAIKNIIDSDPEIAGKIKFLIVGEGDRRGRLENLAERLGIKKNVIFLGFLEDVKPILKTLKVLVLPSFREGQPVILLEAMAMGLPIVATDIDGIKETIVNDKTGILVPAGDPLALSKAILHLFIDRNKAYQIGQQAKKIAYERFEIKDKIEQHQKLYEAILQQK